MNIPAIIKQHADKGTNIEYLGTKKETQYFSTFFEGQKTGFPVVLALTDNAVKKITGFEALALMRL